MTTPLYPAFEKRITGEIQQLLRAQVDPWIFLEAGPPLKVSKHDGSVISYKGVRFNGSPRRVFWTGYIEPFLEDIAIQQITAAVHEAREREIDARVLLPEVQGLLLSGCKRIYTRMADIDQRLLGGGFPDSIPLRPTDREYKSMQEFIAKHVGAELAMWKSSPWYEGWYARNKFVVWIVGIVVSIFSLVAKFLLF